jgi:hypothetical protein
MLHVRYNEESHDFSEQDAGITAGMTDDEIIEAAAQALDVGIDDFTAKNMAVDRRPNGDVVVRPEAVYG